MEGAVKQNSLNASPLPQRQQRGNLTNMNLGKHTPPKQNAASDGNPAEKKAKLGGNIQNGGGVAGGGGIAGGGGGGGTGGVGFSGNRNRGGKQNQNRQGFQGAKNAHQKQINESPKPAVGNVPAKNNEPLAGNRGENHPNQSDNGQGNHGDQGEQGNQGSSFRGRGGGQTQPNQNANQEHSYGNHGNQEHNQGGQGHRGAGGGSHQRGNRSRRSGGSGGMNYSLMGGAGQRSEDFFIAQRLRSISGPTHELPPVELPTDNKFVGRNRLYVGNLTSDTTDDDLREMFKPYGEISEIFSNPEKNFTFPAARLLPKC
ncbi:GM15177 [Drosophila sechellia]|uniref:GM15177 n=1 Tax=Drosophila sechellia TaxID=7238 RepID=B4IBS3_DROSE|nr:GM15177 [Drosophila sechellia]